MENNIKEKLNKLKNIVSESEVMIEEIKQESRNKFFLELSELLKKHNVEISTSCNSSIDVLFKDIELRQNYFFGLGFKKITVESIKDRLEKDE